MTATVLRAAGRAARRATAVAALAISLLLAIGSTAPAWSFTDAPHTVARAGSTTLPRVDIYGDSVTWESEYFMVLALLNRADVHMHVYPGAQICQWFSDMQSTAAAHPNMVIITEGVWGTRGCEHTSNLFREAQDDLSTAAGIFSASRVVLSPDPVVINTSQYAPLMGARNYPKVLAAFRNAASLHPNATFNNAATSVAPNNRFVWKLPCLYNETASMGCTNGQILVRQPDGMHLCPVTPAQPGKCPVYSSGERRWAAGVTRPAVNAYPLQG